MANSRLAKRSTANNSRGRNSRLATTTRMAPSVACGRLSGSTVATRTTMKTTVAATRPVTCVRPPRRPRDLRARRARVDGERAAQAGHGAAGPDDDKIAVQVVGRRRGGGPTLDDRGLHDAHECHCERWCDQVTEVGPAGAVHPQRREPTPHRSQHVHAVLTQPENRHAHDRAHHPPAAPQESGGPPAARARPPAGPRRR